MAVPKKRTSKAKKNSRKANWKRKATKSTQKSCAQHGLARPVAWQGPRPHAMATRATVGASRRGPSQRMSQRP